MNSKNTRDVMVTFVPAILLRLDAHCKRTGLKRSTAVMQAVERFLVPAFASYPVQVSSFPAKSAELHPHPAKPAPRVRTETTLKKKLKRGK